MNETPGVSGIGVVALLVGSLASLGFGAAHGDLPEGSGGAALDFVASHPAYAAVHLGSIIGALLWTLGLLLLRRSLGRPTARALAEIASVTALVGMAVFAVQFSIDGYGLEGAAAIWSGGTAEQRATVAEAVEMVVMLEEGTAMTWVMLLWGVPTGLFGAATLVEGRIAAWVGWLGVTVGTVAVAGGLALFLRTAILPDWLVFPIAVIGASLWGLALGVGTWRGSAPEQAAAESSPRGSRPMKRGSSN